MFERQLQNYVTHISDAVGIEVSVADCTGAVIASSNEDIIENTNDLVLEFIGLNEQEANIQGILLKKVIVKNKLEYVIFTSSKDQSDLKCLSIISIAIEGMKFNYDEKFDKTTLIKGIAIGSIPAENAALRAKDLHVAFNMPRVVFMIKTPEAKDVYSHEIIEGLFPNKTKDFVINLDRERTILIKELKAVSEYREVEKIARNIADTLTGELMIKSYIGIGSVSETLADLNRSYNEAEASLLIGSMFMDGYIYRYDSLGLGRLIYQLPESSCTLFLNEIFKDDTFDFMDLETMQTIQKFFKNNLNISEASRQLFVHRNTLVYRLDKIQKTTGLDLRNFDDAITFKIAMLVKCYLEKKGKV